jgi:hypothetical protein
LIAEAPWELWAILLSIILFAGLPIIVGVIAIKLFRLFRPIEQVEERRIGTVGSSNKDGFFKILLVGWLICGPVYYIVYHVTTNSL